MKRNQYREAFWHLSKRRIISNAWAWRAMYAVAYETLINGQRMKRLRAFVVCKHNHPLRENIR